MLFNSHEFIFIFLPITYLIYFYLNKKRLTVASKGFLVASSLFFYSWWNIIYLPLILSSIAFNYTVASVLGKKPNKIVLSFGVIANLALLGYFKYTNFFIENINAVFDSPLPLINLALPLAISFFTFQQIAYLVDCYREGGTKHSLLDYALFVTFFPQLIAGPIVHHKEMMPQFLNIRTKVLNYKNIALGLFIFSIGLFKKVVLADTFAIWANAGFDTTTTLNFYEAWAASLSYTFQLYFDFSGYTDMAIGLALLFNIKLPTNFNSPYKAKNIQDFWRRWHITLSRFLRDYVYIPLGGNKIGNVRTYVNLMATFILGGLWHGAGWTFIFWGFLHGAALITHRLWSYFGIKLWGWLAWLITFNFINASWVFFRASDWKDAINILSSMVGLSKGENFLLSLKFIDTISMWTNTSLYNVLPFQSEKNNVDNISIIFCFIAIIMVLSMNNSQSYLNKKITNKMVVFSSVIFSCSIIKSLLSTTTVFLYFNF